MLGTTKVASSINITVPVNRGKKDVSLSLNRPCMLQLFRDKPATTTSITAEKLQLFGALAAKHTEIFEEHILFLAAAQAATRHAKTLLTPAIER